MTKQVDERARWRLRARFRDVLVRYRTTQALIDEELESPEIEEIEHAVELWDSRVLSALGEADLVILVDVLAALQRVADGAYGRCTACGDEIAPGRLEALPEAARCIACARGPAARRRPTAPTNP